jgi:hypothetical protein
MKLMKLLSKIFHQNSKKDFKKDPKDVDYGSYYLMCTRDLKDLKKKAKSNMYKAKADERMASGASPFSHRCGRGGPIRK